MNPIKNTSARPDWIFRQSAGACSVSLAIFIACLSANLVNLFAQVAVKTLTGGPVVAGGPYSGLVDGGALQSAQFNRPAGIALDSGGLIYLADQNNGRIRTVDVTRDRVRTFISGLNQPVDLIVDSSTNLFILTAGDGSLSKYDRFGNQTAPRIGGFVNPTAFAIDSQTNIYVAEMAGRIKRLTSGGVVTLLVEGLGEVSGVALAADGALAISDSARHTILRYDLETRVLTVLAGGNGAGFRDGTFGHAQFKSPGKLAKAPNGMLVVADTGNHRLRLVETNGTTYTLYGTNSVDWVSNYPGWEDGDSSFAESREPFSVAVSKDGSSVYVTEIYYHIIRQATGLALGATSSDGSGQAPGGLTIRLQSPSISPTYGYHPMGAKITISSASPKILYTLDGTEPSTNSLVADTVGGLASINWSETQRDLRSLRVRALDGTNTSSVVSGLPSSKNEIGVPRDLTAGPGSTAIVPIVLNLKTNTPIKSLQYRVEITPQKGPPINRLVRALPVSANDFIPIVNSVDAQGVIRSSVYGYDQGTTRGLVLTYLGTNANFSVMDFAVAGMISVPIPAQANEGDTYTVSVVQPSATSDAFQKDVLMEPMAPKVITVRRTGFVVGDTSLSRWYNSESSNFSTENLGFGDGILRNSDVNNAFLASFGIRVPYTESDLFIAMDAFPEDSPRGVGGDGQIRFLDWQVILERSIGAALPSIGMQTNLWKRFWEPGTGLLPEDNQTPLRRTSLQAGSVPSTKSPAVWFRNASVGGTTLEHVSAGKTVEMPIYLTVRRGSALAGLQFRAALVPSPTAPELSVPVSFVVSEQLPPPLLMDGAKRNEIGCAWSLFGNSFTPAVSGRIRLGSIKLVIPATARTGDSYSLQLSNLDGSPLPVEQYEFESFRNSIWINSPALSRDSEISQEWKAKFFGADAPDSILPISDTDGDGLTDANEYHAGTDPLNPDSRLQLRVETARPGLDGIVKLRWSTAPGVDYLIEASGSLGEWVAVSPVVSGDGGEAMIDHSVSNSGFRFYRVRVVQ